MRGLGRHGSPMRFPAGSGAMDILTKEGRDVVGSDWVRWVAIEDPLV